MVEEQRVLWNGKAFLREQFPRPTIANQWAEQNLKCVKNVSLRPKKKYIRFDFSRLHNFYGQLMKKTRLYGTSVSHRPELKVPLKHLGTSSRTNDTF